MSEPSEYAPPKVWTWDKAKGGRFAKTNRPIAGPTHEKELPVGRHPLQLYSLGTPNGVKVTIMLEELLALGKSGAEYDAWLIDIGEGEQFGSGFVAVNPNSKIPALVDRSGPTPIRVFESGRSCSISPRSSARFCQPRRPRAPNAFPGCSGRWAARPIWVAAWPFLRLRADQDRICHRPLRDGGEAAARRARPPPCRKRLRRRPRLYDRRHRHLPLVRRTGEGLAIRSGRVPQRAGLQTRSALGRHAARAAGGEARADGQPHPRRARRASCASATKQATSRPRRRTRSPPGGLTGRGRRHGAERLTQITNADMVADRTEARPTAPRRPAPVGLTRRENR